MRTVINIAGYPLEAADIWRLEELLESEVIVINNPTRYVRSQNLWEQLTTAITTARPTVLHDDVIVAPSIHPAADCVRSLFPYATVYSINEIHGKAAQRSNVLQRSR